MPRYDYHCPTQECYRKVGIIERDVPMRARDAQDCPNCGGKLKRRFVMPHAAPIPGIPNAVNRHWNEGGTPIDTRKVDDLVNGATR